MLKKSQPNRVSKSDISSKTGQTQIETFNVELRGKCLAKGSLTSNFV